MCPNYSEKSVARLFEIYRDIEHNISQRLAEFKSIWENGSEEDLFKELVFCIFTPQSNAHICWDAVNMLHDSDLLFQGSEKRIAQQINTVRFRYNKARNVVLARKLFQIDEEICVRSHLRKLSDNYKMREWLVRNVHGIGYILDRHILKNLVNLYVIAENPKFMSYKRYLEIERKMLKFAEKVGIPAIELDLLLWYKEKGEIFK
jgi:N-glycosylase/DNA lyase